MNGWSFPHIFKNNEIAVVEGKDCVITHLKLLYNSEVFEFTQDPGYGSNVPLLKLRQKNQLTLDLLVDAITQAEMFIPNVTFDRNSVRIAYTRAGAIDLTMDVRIDLATYPITLQLEI